MSKYGETPNVSGKTMTKPSRYIGANDRSQAPVDSLLSDQPAYYRPLHSSGALFPSNVDVLVSL